MRILIAAVALLSGVSFLTAGGAYKSSVSNTASQESGRSLAKTDAQKVSVQPTTWGRDEFRTGDWAVLCSSPFSLDEGFKAAQSGDAKWLKDAGCLVAQTGLKAIRISTPVSSQDRGPWQVRVTAVDGQGFTLWGYDTGFTSPDGSKVR